MSIENFRKKMKVGNSRLWGIKIDWTQRMKKTNQAQATPRRMEKGGSCTVIEILSTILHLDPIYVYRRTLSCSIATCLLLELNLGSLKPDPASYPKNPLAWSSKSLQLQNCTTDRLQWPHNWEINKNGKLPEGLIFSMKVMSFQSTT